MFKWWKKEHLVTSEGGMEFQGQHPHTEFYGSRAVPVIHHLVWLLLVTKRIETLTAESHCPGKLKLFPLWSSAEQVCALCMLRLRCGVSRTSSSPIISFPSPPHLPARAWDFAIRESLI